MTIRIVTDSTCDLPAEVIARYGIHVVPLYIQVGGQSYLDGVDITRQQFYTQLPTYTSHPTTAAPSIQRFQSAYSTLAEEDASQILSIHISKSLSAVADVAHLAAKETLSVPVTVIDSQQVSLGTGFLVEKAAQMAAAGHAAAEILAALNDQIRRTHVFAALDTLEFLKRSGRMNKYMAGFGTLLRIKPILTMYDGKPGTERARTRRGAWKRLVEMLAAVGPLERVALLHTYAPQENIARLRRMASHLLGQGAIQLEVITPVIGAHIGPGTLGFVVIRASES